jgi:hypothetical protein
LNLVGILVDIHQLNEYIEQGDVDKATKLFKQLASQGIQFQAKISEKLPNDNMFPYVMNSSFLWFFISRLVNTLAFELESMIKFRELVVEKNILF